MLIKIELFYTAVDDFNEDLKLISISNKQWRFAMHLDDRANQLHATMHRSLYNIHVVDVCMLLIVLNDRLNAFTCVNNAKSMPRKVFP